MGPWRGWLNQVRTAAAPSFAAIGVFFWLAHQLDRVQNAGRALDIYQLAFDVYHFATDWFYRWTGIGRNLFGVSNLGQNLVTLVLVMLGAAAWSGWRAYHAFHYRLAFARAHGPERPKEGGYASGAAAGAVVGAVVGSIFGPLALVTAGAGAVLGLLSAASSNQQDLAAYNAAMDSLDAQQRAMLPNAINAGAWAALQTVIGGALMLFVAYHITEVRLGLTPIDHLVNGTFEKVAGFFHRQR